MAEYKNQHYVPKFLLRGWTDDEKVAVYNLDNQQEYPKTSISNLCSEDYFYGDSEAERGMDGLENLHAGIINKIRSSKSFDVLTRTEIQYFCIFVQLQRNRTKQKKEEMDSIADNLAKELLKLKAEAGEIDTELGDGRDALDLLDRFRITREKPLAYPMLQALTGVDLIKDLEVAIIENQSDTPFVISDHPVVHDNRRYKNEIDRFLVGIQNRGLQIFLPLSDTLQIMLYDPAAYFVDYSNKEKRRVSTSRDKVAAGLNDLQLINAFESIYYRELGREQEFQKAQQRLSEYITKDPTVFRRMAPGDHNFDTDNEIIESGFNLPDYSPFLPFVKQRVETEFAIERRPEISKQHKEYLDEILEDARKEMDEK